MCAVTANVEISSSKEILYWLPLKKSTIRKSLKKEKLRIPATLIQMNQAELHPPTVPRELLISTYRVTITTALLNTNCFMWMPKAEGNVNIELDKVLFFFFLCFISPLVPHSPATSPGCIGFKQMQALTSKSCSSLMIALQKGFLLT